jgi:epoxyqueuosine reductase QueG
MIQAHGKARSLPSNLPSKDDDSLGFTLARQIRATALSCGADLVGIADAGLMPEHKESFHHMLPGTTRVVVVVTRHSLSALDSRNNQVRQFDTIHTYDESARAAHSVVRKLEDLGYVAVAVAVPAFIPIDMKAPKNGMKGEISWRTAAVQAGLGSWGENGLLVTRDFGSAVRICGVATNAPLEADRPLVEDVCDHCMDCVKSCPTQALSGGGKIDKKKCGDHIFRYGFRSFQAFMSDLFERDAKARTTINGYGLREMWQNFMTGNYYYCFRCQTRCHRSSSAPNDP